MTEKIKVDRCRLDDNLSSLNPKSDHFSFELWAAKVGQQMKLALKTSLISKRTEI